MRRIIILSSLIFFIIQTQAQNKKDSQKEVQLQEVKVKASKIINKADGRQLLPTEAQKVSSSNGYDLLNKLSFPTIRVDEVGHTITALGHQGDVQMRINGILASKDDLLALDPRLVKSIDFINNPGVRYGENIAYVINIRTIRNEDGYTLGTDLNNTVTTWHGDNTIYTRINHKKSQFGLTYNSFYRNFKGSRYQEEADYLLNSGAHEFITRRGQDSQSKEFDHNLELQYNLSDSASHLFQATFSTDFNHFPRDFEDRLIHSSDQDYIATIRNHSKQFSPVLDLYFSSHLGGHQNFTANIVGTHLVTRTDNYNDEGSPYTYTVNGKTWSLVSEFIYENRLKPFTLSLGLHQKLKYTRNDYSGDVESLDNMHDAEYYLFGEIKGNIKKAGYVIGCGTNHDYYRQGEYHYNYWLMHPKITFTYPLLKSLNLNYTFEISQHISQVAMISNTQIRKNSMEWTVGNPNLKPTKKTAQQFKITYAHPRLTSELNFTYLRNRNCNLASYSRSDDNQFYYTQKNQHAIDMIYLQNNNTFDLIPEKLSLSFYGGIYRFLNIGDDYRHYLTSYNIGGSVQAYLGNLTITANTDNGWKFMEGETNDHQCSGTYFTFNYRIKNCSISLYWQMPFQKNPKTDYAELVNQYIHKKMTYYNSDLGNMLTIGFSWKIHHGKKYLDIKRKVENKDTQTGIL